jgi:hypothetical protein
VEPVAHLYIDFARKVPLKSAEDEAVVVLDRRLATFNAVRDAVKLSRKSLPSFLSLSIVINYG